MRESLFGTYEPTQEVKSRLHRKPNKTRHLCNERRHHFPPIHGSRRQGGVQNRRRSVRILHCPQTDMEVTCRCEDNLLSNFLSTFQTEESRESGTDLPLKKKNRVYRVWFDIGIYCVDI